jgi:TadE-like protein
MNIATGLLRCARDSTGSVLVEVTIVLTILIFFILGSIDFLFVFYEWNAATKAVQVGARIAAVSNPVASNLDGISTVLVSATLRPGSAMPSFMVTCDGSVEKCRCEGACPGGEVVYDAAAMNTIVYGRASKACGDATSSYTAGMCDIFNRITPANVRIEYRQPAAPAGLGYVGRPGGPIPTIKVSLQNIPLRFFFLGILLHDISMPELATTMTGQDLYSCSPIVRGCADSP